MSFLAGNLTTWQHWDGLLDGPSKQDKKKKTREEEDNVEYDDNSYDDMEKEDVQPQRMKGRQILFSDSDSDKEEEVKETPAIKGPDYPVESFVTAVGLVYCSSGR